MPKPIDHWEWNEPSFAKWRRAVNARLKDVYLITIEDAGIDEQELTQTNEKTSHYDHFGLVAQSVELRTFNP